MCIGITTIKNIYESFHGGDDIVYLPPDERSIEKLEGVLHNPVAIDYFYQYLESLEQAYQGPDEDDNQLEITLLANHNHTFDN